MPSNMNIVLFLLKIISIILLKTQRYVTFIIQPIENNNDNTTNGNSIECQNLTECMYHKSNMLVYIWPCIWVVDKTKETILMKVSKF